ncbi:hypothetical protein V7S43_006794 [Phytophthora oleae]|uniref:Uncharacterized protein n=1 Tax=Phytophthora oleae TaxID=2107226 RepID=A0ABD3FQF3_9STRA
MLNSKYQGKKANQGEVLMTLYALHTTVLDCSKELRDYQSTGAHRMAFRPEDLTQMASSTRKLLHDAFHSRLFSRYTDRNVMEKCLFVLEMQLFLHPNFKSFGGFLKRIVTLCNAGENSAATGGGKRNFAKIKKMSMTT